jgi:putative flippase GtrA
LKRLKAALSISLLKQLIFKVPVRYSLVAIVGFFIDFSIYASLVAMGSSVYLANTAGFCAGATLNVILIRTFVFPDSRFTLRSDVLLTMATNGAMFILGIGMLWVSVDLLSINPYFAKLLVNGVTFVLNYVVRIVFFRKK